MPHISYELGDALLSSFHIIVRNRHHLAIFKLERNHSANDQLYLQCLDFGIALIHHRIEFSILLLTSSNLRIICLTLVANVLIVFSFALTTIIFGYKFKRII